MRRLRERQNKSATAQCASEREMMDSASSCYCPGAQWRLRRPSTLLVLPSSQQHRRSGASWLAAPRACIAVERREAISPAAGGTPSLLLEAHRRDREWFASRISHLPIATRRGVIGTERDPRRWLGAMADNPRRRGQCQIGNHAMAPATRARVGSQQSRRCGAARRPRHGQPHDDDDDCPRNKSFRVLVWVSFRASLPRGSGIGDGNGFVLGPTGYRDTRARSAADAGPFFLRSLRSLLTFAWQRRRMHSALAHCLCYLASFFASLCSGLGLDSLAITIRRAPLRSSAPNACSANRSYA